MSPALLEQVSLTLAAQPVPPLPIFANEEVPDEITAVEKGCTVANSHDLWGAMLLTHVRKQKTKDEVAALREKQAAFVNKLTQDLKCINVSSTGAGSKEQRVYDVFCDFTRSSIGAISGKTNLLFAPFEHVCRGDSLHTAMCHHAGAQDTIFGPLKSDGGGQAKRSGAEFQDFEYQSLVMRQYARILESC
jgi:hypothetical protein